MYDIKNLIQKILVEHHLAVKQYKEEVFPVLCIAALPPKSDTLGSFQSWVEWRDLMADKLVHVFPQNLMSEQDSLTDCIAETYHNLSRHIEDVAPKPPETIVVGGVLYKRVDK